MLRALCSDCHFHRNLGMRLIAYQLEIFKLEIIDIGDLRTLDDEFGERLWLPLQLLSQGLNVIHVDVSVAQSVHEIPRLQNVHLD